MTRAEPPRPPAPLPNHRNTSDPIWQRIWANYTFLTTPLRERGLVCDVGQGLNSTLIYAYPPGHDSVLIIGPEDGGWLVTHQAPAEDWTDFAAVYDSRGDSTPPAGPDARHGRLVEPLLTVIDAFLAQLPREPSTPHSAGSPVAGVAAPSAATRATRSR
ncbi:hypothetical protein OG756_33960 [Streptomyces sp. NBC_01310]|uniref:hypothetical protein n=1 Tax=Streptomyces sp. NBC_01310 TaxID=2903820 RepID=UPI0035B62E9E|nr:hypothetical protein OG756_33960 [Streptomyces sp. NBC_01310]